MPGSYHRQPPWRIETDNFARRQPFPAEKGAQALAQLLRRRFEHPRRYLFAPDLKQEVWHVSNRSAKFKL